MKKIFQKINAGIRLGLNIVVRMILRLVYFILLFPFVIFVKACADFLEIKTVKPSWKRRPHMDDVGDFLKHQ